MKDYYTIPILSTSLIYFSLKDWKNVLFGLGSERLSAVVVVVVVIFIISTIMLAVYGHGHHEHQEVIRRRHQQSQRLRHRFNFLLQVALPCSQEDVALTSAALQFFPGSWFLPKRVTRSLGANWRAAEVQAKEDAGARK